MDREIREAPAAGGESTPTIHIGLVNNMPDAALEATELQFGNLLRSAAGTLKFVLHFFAMPEIARSAAALRGIEARYRAWSEIWNCGLDAVIVTGAEPRSPRLDEEAYWPSLAALIDWAKTQVASSIWSCLAAHAAVLHLDGIERRRLADKCFGVFAHDVDCDDSLTSGSPSSQSAPHSRWNELPPSALESNGYRILTRSSAAGVNLFTKHFGSPFVFWQGHPEYDEKALLKEYQRDVIRFLRHERDTYPARPVGYFGPAVSERMTDFQMRAAASRSDAIIASFPFEAAAADAVNDWRAPALQIYHNWLRGLADAKVPPATGIQTSTRARS